MHERERNVASATIRILACAAMIVMAIAILTQSVAGGGIFGRRREQARRTSCLSNLKQFGLGLKQYAQDFEEVYPWHTGLSKPKNAWYDLGLMYPNYMSAISVYICPSSKDKKFEPKSESGDKADYPFEPFKPADNKEVISYAYGYDSTGKITTARTDNARSTVRLLADKKAGIEATADSNHKDDGRNLLYQDGHVMWKAGADAVDPDEEDDDVGKPDAKDYADWWSDPPWYGESMEEEEEGATAEGAEHAE
jgi:prepilin-type processing-associated H-X9-DG protein